MDPDRVELHDARLTEMRIDYRAGTATVEVELYLDPGATERSKARIVFEEVVDLSQVAAFERLAQHAKAGNINYWVPAQNGTTFLYLSDGCVAVNAKRVRCELV